MPTQKFEYAISGVELNEEQKASISGAIASAVSAALLTEVNRGALLKGKVWGAIGGANGGNLAVAANRADLNKRLTLDSSVIK